MSSANWLDYTANWQDSGFIQFPSVKRQVTKLGSKFPKSVVLTDSFEFWPFAILGSEIPNWPANEYPVLLYTSSDHSDGVGGIFLRVYEAALGSIEDASSWHEWQVVSNRPEFSHITQKNNPIYVETNNGDQSETPHVNVIGGTVYLWYHNAGVAVSSPDFSNYGGVQATKYATGTNGVDFTNEQIALSYNGRWLEGDGHSGYLRFGLNTISEIPFTYIARATHGGFRERTGGAQAIYVSNDAINWQRYKIWGRGQGILKQFSATGEEDFIYNLETVSDARVSAPFYRIIGTYRPPVIEGGSDDFSRPLEYLVDSDFNVVARPSELIPLGVTGEFDSREVQQPAELLYNGTRYVFYKGSNGSVDSIGMGIVTEVPHTWDVFYTLSNKTSLLEINADGTTAPNTLTYDGTATGSIRSDFLGDNNFIRLELETTGAVSTAVVNQSITLSNYEVVDIYFDKIGKEASWPTEMEFGLTDSVTTPTRQINYRFNPSNGDTSARSERMIIKRIGTANDGEVLTNNYFGQSELWASFRDESPWAKHDLGLRIIPSQNKMYTLSGVTTMDEIDLTGFDFTQPLNIFMKGNMVGVRPEGSIGISFQSISAISSTLGDLPQDTTPPVITLNGSNPVIVTQGDTYTDAGATALDDVDGDITANIVTVNPVNTATLGTYTVTYNVQDSAGNNAVEVTRTVVVEAAVDVTPPVITVIPNNQTITVGDAIPTFTATATDDTDGNITADIVESGDTIDNNTVGVYTRRWNVQDSAGNAATEVVRTVTVQLAPDVTAPVITVSGNAVTTLTVGDPIPVFTATATDDRDGDITDNIVESGDIIDNTTAGTYVRRFNVQDSAGNNAVEVTRTVVYEVAQQLASSLDGYRISYVSNVLIRNRDNPISVNVQFLGAYRDGGLANFDRLEVLIGGETYSTDDVNTSVVVTSSNVKVYAGPLTQLEPGFYDITLVGYNTKYTNGYELTSPANPLLGKIKLA